MTLSTATRPMPHIMPLLQPIMLLMPLSFAAQSATTLAAGDAVRGAAAFRQCAACHSTKPDEHLTGPSLAHIAGQKAGTQKGFLRYSDALKQSGVTWNDKSLDQWLTSPERFIPGNSMTFPGIQNAAARQDLIISERSV
jgi:cytochrome c